MHKVLRGVGLACCLPVMALTSHSHAQGSPDVRLDLNLTRGTHKSIRTVPSKPERVPAATIDYSTTTTIQSSPTESAGPLQMQILPIGGPDVEEADPGEPVLGSRPTSVRSTRKLQCRAGTDGEDDCRYVRVLKLPEPSSAEYSATWSSSEKAAIDTIVAPKPETVNQVVVRFQSAPAKAELRALIDKGITVGEKVGDNAYLATTQRSLVTTNAALSAQSGTMLEALDPSRKIDADLVEAAAFAAGDSAVQVQRVSIDFGTFEAFDAGVAKIGNIERIEIIDSDDIFFTLEADIALDTIDALSEIPEVRRITGKALEYAPLVDGMRGAVGLAAYGAAGQPTGAGVTIGVWDAGKVLEHAGYSNRLQHGQTVFHGLHDRHATHVAGILIGDGSSVRDISVTRAPPLLLSPGRPGVAESDDATAPETAALSNEIPASLFASDAVSATLPDQRRYVGVATDAQIVSYDLKDAPREHAAAIRDHGIAISNNSWGAYVDRYHNCNLFGKYDDTARKYDEIVRGRLGEPVVAVFAAGNYRDKLICEKENGAPEFANYGVIVPPGTAKNGITVGAINSDDNTITDFSSYGPTADGRLKPDLMAPGCERGGDGGISSTSSANRYRVDCGTSMATPVVTGAVALLMEYLRDNGQADLDPATYKALLIHSAEDIETPGPDYRTGYGRLRIDQALALAGIGNFFQIEVPEATNPEERPVIEAALPVPSGVGELKVTLVWDDPAGALDGALTQDLDMQLVDPASQEHYPWVLDPTRPAEAAVQGRDTLNNVEQAVVANPAPGEWTVRIQGPSAPALSASAQRFSLVVSAE